MIKHGAELRFLRGWSKEEIKERLEGLSSLPRSFEFSGFVPRKTLVVEKFIAAESFEHAKAAVARYEFSDPRIVRAYFDPTTPLLGRRMLLEIQALGFHFLCGTVIGEVLESENAQESLFGYRYDTLEGHIESGMEWFILRKIKKTGEISFRIQAKWRPGRFPNRWSKIGFHLLVGRYQRTWHRLAFGRLSGASC